MVVFATMSATVLRAVNGGHSTMSTCRDGVTPSRMARASARASAKVPCIFQLPMTSGVRIASHARIGEGLDAGQLTAFEKLQEGAARRRDVADLRLDPRATDRGDRVSAPDDGEGGGIGDHASDAEGSRSERRFLEDTHRSVPHD